MTLLARASGMTRRGEPIQELPRLVAAQDALATPEPLFLAGGGDGDSGPNERRASALRAAAAY